MQVAVISGVTGQTGSYLAETLLDKGYFVIGFSRRVSVDTSERIRHLLTNANFQFEEGDICDPHYITSLLTKYRVAEFYNLAAQSHVGTSFKQPVVTSDINYGGVLNILNCIKELSPTTKFYQASTSELFGSSYDTESGSSGPAVKKLREILGPNIDGGNVSFTYTDGLPLPSERFAVKLQSMMTQEIHGPITVKYQDENTKMSPQSPYAVAKLGAHHLVRLYRESYGIYAAAGILFNHESPRRGDKFVTKKITKYIGELFQFCGKDIKKLYVNSGDLDKEPLKTINFPDENVYCSDKPAAGQHVTPGTDKYMPKLRLGNLDASRDWGHAKDSAEGMHTILQQDKPDDFVLCTEETHTIREFLTVAFNHVGVTNWEPFVVIDPEFYRPAEVDYLRGSCKKARETFGWKPSYSFEALVKEMVEAEV
jgi:GDPmannose 4,6-dehydratase